MCAWVGIHPSILFSSAEFDSSSVVMPEQYMNALSYVLGQVGYTCIMGLAGI